MAELLREMIKDKLLDLNGVRIIKKYSNIKQFPLTLVKNNTAYIAITNYPKAIDSQWDCLIIGFLLECFDANGGSCVFALDTKRKSDNSDISSTYEIEDLQLRTNYAISMELTKDPLVVYKTEKVNLLYKNTSGSDVTAYLTLHMVHGVIQR